MELCLAWLIDDLDGVGCGESCSGGGDVRKNNSSIELQAAVTMDGDPGEVGGKGGGRSGGSGGGGCAAPHGCDLSRGSRVRMR